MFDDSIHNYVEFKYVTYNDDGEPLVNITRRVVGDDTDYLPHLLMEFMYFLHGMTFTYVENVVAVSKNGEHSAFDVVEGIDLDEEE